VAYCLPNMITAQQNRFHYAVSDTVISIRMSKNRAIEGMARKLHILGVMMHSCIP
jgi:hypothetical protein